MMNKTISILRAPALQALCRRSANVKRAARVLLMTLLLTMTAQTAWATDVTLSGSDNYTANVGDVLTGSTSGTVTIADNANITLNNATINGGIVCNGTATITLVGTNSVSGATNKAGIQIGGSGTTLTIKGNGSLTANGGNNSAGIGLSALMNYDSNVSSGNIVIEGGTITAIGGHWGAGIGTGVIKNTNNDNSTSVQFGNVTIKGGTVTATGGDSGDGIGKGYSYPGPAITFGTVTIYDGIDMVDATSISESVTYMHDETDVTANASNYFTITEDGNRRIIAPKDDTDYTITIADDIEHGTLTGAATAKYMEKVTITATPALGYRFSRLVVKDAQNNDVASTGNSFFMPKGDVTVSAVFEQGVHGTTEFAWGYSGPDGFVTEATIYDGVTTVELQQGQSYRIYKYDEDSYRKFLLDNNIYNVTIPYSGGTGTFTYANGTNFNINSGELGYYDITMTDVGNDKWSVSILKTVGVIDNIPDQTYTGSEIAPEPLVMAGSLSLNKGTDYEYSYENNTNVGTAKVTVTFKGDYASLGSVEKEFTITKATPTVTAPTAIADLVYTGSAQALVTGGTTDVGDILSYCLEEKGMYSADIPTGTNAGTYTVYYKVDGSDNWNAVAGGTVEVPISPKAVTVTAEAKSKEYGTADPELTATVEGLVGEDAISYTVSRTAGEAVGEYTITPTGEATQGNYTVSFVAGTLTITMPTQVSITLAKEYGTYCSEYDLDFSDATGLTAYIAAGYNTSNGSLLMVKVTSVPAGTGLLLKSTAGSTYTANVHTSPYVYSNLLTGTTTETEVSGNDYILGKDEAGKVAFYPAQPGKLAPGKAYLKGLPAPSSARMMINLVFDDDATAIENYRQEASTTNDWYTLDGRKLEGKPTRKGLYVKNGKKVVVR